MKKLILILLLIPIVYAVQDVPSTIDVNFLLRNTSTGNLIGDGDYNVNFSLNQVSDDSALYSENQTKTISSGIGYQTIGMLSMLPSSIFLNNLYLLIEVQDSQITQKYNLSTYPYSFVSQYTRNVSASNVIEVVTNGTIKLYNTTQEIFSVTDNGTFPYHNNIVTNITNHQNTFKHGNTTAEIRAQFSGSDNVTIYSGVISINKSFAGWDTDSSNDVALNTTLGGWINATEYYTGDMKLNSTGSWYNDEKLYARTADVVVCPQGYTPVQECDIVCDSDCSVQINQEITAGSKVIYLESLQDFIVNGTIWLVPNVSILSNGATIKVADGATFTTGIIANKITDVIASDIELAGFKIDGNHRGGSPILIYKPRRVYIHNIQIENGNGTGLYMLYGHSQFRGENTVRDVIVKDTKNDCFASIQVTHSIYDHLTAINCTNGGFRQSAGGGDDFDAYNTWSNNYAYNINPIGSGYDFIDSRHVSMYNNWAIGGASIGFELANDMEYLYVDGMFAINNTARGIGIITAPATRKIINNLYAEGNGGEGIVIGGANFSVISNLIAINNSEEGVYIGSMKDAVVSNIVSIRNGYEGLQLSSLDKMTFSNIVLRDNDQGNTVSGGMIISDSRGVDFDGITSYDSQSSPTQDFGIEFSSTAKNISVTNFRSSGNLADVGGTVDSSVYVEKVQDGKIYTLYGSRNIDQSDMAKIDKGASDIGLVIYAPLNGNANDYSRNPSDGAISGSVSEEGLIGTGYYMDGTGDEISFGLPSKLEFYQGSFTTMVWIKTIGQSDYMWMFRGRNYDQVLDPTYLNTYNYNRSGSRIAVSTLVVGTVLDGTWHHIVNTFDGSSNISKVYIDGVLKGNYTLAGGLGNSTATETEFSNDGSVNSFNGTVDEIRIFNRSLSANEVVAYYNLYSENYGSIFVKEEQTVSFGNLTLAQKITFTLGEIIDNIKDDWIKITGNLQITKNINVTGNITINQNLGVGTSSPTSPLHVIGNTNITGNAAIYGDVLFFNGSAETLSLKNPSGSDTVLIINQSTAASSQTAFIATATGSLATVGKMYREGGAANEYCNFIQSQANANANLIFCERDLNSASTAGPLMRLLQQNAGDDQHTLKCRNDGSGSCIYIESGPGVELFVEGEVNITGNAIFNSNVGIGTTNPNAKLEVAGGVNLNNTLYVNETTGNVGIGTSNPATKLEVVGNITIDDSAMNNCQGSNQVLTTDSNGQIICVNDATGTGGGGFTGVDNVYIWNNSNTITLNETKLNNTIKNIDTATNTSMKTYVDAQDSAQDECSEITGCVEGALTSESDPNYATDKVNISWLNESNTFIENNQFSKNLTIANNLIVGGDNFYVDNSSGNVGIGTTSPNYKLDLTDSSNIAARFGSSDGTKAKIIINAETSSADSLISFAEEGSSRFSLGRDDSLSNALVFSASNDLNTPKMVIETGGNVGIGTTSPSSKLDVNGTGTFVGLNTTGDFKVNSKFNVTASTGDVNVGGLFYVGNILINSTSGCIQKVGGGKICFI